jgi:hypothetical protein
VQNSSDLQTNKYRVVLLRLVVLRPTLLLLRPTLLLLRPTLLLLKLLVPRVVRWVEVRAEIRARHPRTMKLFSSMTGFGCCRSYPSTRSTRTPR